MDRPDRNGVCQPGVSVIGTSVCGLLPRGDPRRPMPDPNKIRPFCCCTVCIVMIDAETIDQFWSTYTLSRRYRMSTLDEITKEKQRVGEALVRVDAQREQLVSQLRELEATERVLARYTKGAQARKTSSAKNAHQGNGAGRSSATTRAPAHHDRNTSWRRARLVEPERSGPCSGNRQDAAGNHCCMQGRSPEPCRRRYCPAQAGWPHRRARRKAPRHTGDGTGATRRGLTSG
jgi:Tfp pilus assembly protein PilV